MKVFVRTVAGFTFVEQVKPQLGGQATLVPSRSRPCKLQRTMKWKRTFLIFLFCSVHSRDCRCFHGWSEITEFAFSDSAPIAQGYAFDPCVFAREKHRSFLLPVRVSYRTPAYWVLLLAAKASFFRLFYHYFFDPCLGFNSKLAYSVMSRL